MPANFAVVHAYFPGGDLTTSVTGIILASCCLHNYLVERDKLIYTSACDHEDAQCHAIKSCALRNDPWLCGMSLSVNRNPST